MSLLSREELESLSKPSEGPSVSIYLPTHRAGLEYRKDPIRLKNLLRDAEDQLAAAGNGGAEADTLLQPARQLVEDDLFWQHQSEGLALFLAPRRFRRFRLPLSFVEMAVVGERFHLSPLLPLLTEDGRFYVLALSQNRVRLFDASRHSIRELDLGDIPENLREAVGYDWEQRTLQFHTRAARQGGAGGRAAMFHGHGAATDDRKDEILTFLRLVDQGLLEILHDRQAPLVVAAVDYLIPLYREVSKYPNLADGGIAGNPETMEADDFRRRGWEMVEPSFLASRDRAAEMWAQYAGTGRAGQDVREILPAAFDGRVGTLFVAADVQEWGSYDPEERELRLADQQEPGCEDLLDLAAIESLARGATIYAVHNGEVPGGGSLAAIYRY